MIDLHSHLLPGVDDGSRSVAQSVRVLGEQKSFGVIAFCLTPHLTASGAEAGVPAAYDAAHAALIAAAPDGVELRRGVELMLDRPLGPRAARDPAIRVGGSRYLLVEFPRIVPRETVVSALAQLVALRIVPLLAHPERYSSCSVAAAHAWRQAGAKLQVDATTLLAPTRRGERARRLVAAGMADILAGDNHGDDRTVAVAHQALVANGGEEQAEALLVRNPRAILEDRTLETVEPLTLRTTWATRLRLLLDDGDA